MEALILAGGSGTRFWPLSRRARPKQLLALEGDVSLLRDTVRRLDPLVPSESVWVCTTRLLAERVRSELPEVAADRILAEPTGRNTAPAIGWAVQEIRRRRGDRVVAALPADHRVGDREAFRRALAAAGEAAERERRVLTLGVTPRWVETGYGYLEVGEPVDGDLRRVVRFTEKPEPEEARELVDSGRYLWNAGIFVFAADVVLEHLARLAPDIGRGLAEIAADPRRLDAVYPGLPSISIDHAVMERLDDLLTLPLDCGWSDLGSWAALAEVLAADEAGNASRGDVLAADARDNLLLADRGIVAVLGVEGLVVVRTGDAVLVVPKERSQEVRTLVDELAARGRDDLL